MKKLLLLLAVVFSSLLCTAQSINTAPTSTKRDGQPVTLGMVFSPFSPKVVTAVRIYRFSSWTGSTRVGVWDPVTATLICEGSVPPGGTGWVEVPVQPSVLIDASQYIVGYSNEDGWYSTQPNYFPRQFAEYSAPTSRYVYQPFAIPTETYQNSNYFVEPVLGTETPVGEVCDTVYITENFVQKDTVYIRDTMRIVLRDTVYLPADTVHDVVYIDGRDTVVIDRNASYTDSALLTWPFEGIWNYEFNIGARKYRFLRAFVWRRQVWDGSKWEDND